MNTLDIFTFLNNDEHCSKYFIGVFARDKAPVTFNKIPCLYIVNTDTSTEKGSHWLAIFVDHGRHVEFFDPYGMHPIVYDMFDYVKKISICWTYNNVKIQSHSSQYCGQICLFFLYLRSRNYSLYDISHLFSKDYIENEKIILSFLKFY